MREISFIFMVTDASKKCKLCSKKYICKLFNLSCWVVFLFCTKKKLITNLFELVMTKILHKRSRKQTVKIQRILIRFLTMVHCNPGPVVWRLIGTNQGLHFNSFFFIPLFKSFFQNIFSVLWLVSSHQIVDKRNGTKFYFKAFRSLIRFYTKPDYLNPALNNVVLQSSNFNHKQLFKKF